MSSVSLNRGKDDFLEGYSKLEAPDERMEGKVEGSLFFEGFEELIRKYEGIIAEEWHNVEEEAINSILTPGQINSFLQATMRYEDHKNYSENTGFFITRLIQNSHNAGNNKFTLNTRTLSKEIDWLGFELKGSNDRLLEIIVGGNVGHSCGEVAKNIRGLYIGGNAGNWCGYEAENIGELYIGGNAGYHCGGESRHSVISISGNAGYSCGEESKYSVISISGNAGEKSGLNAKNSTFKTPNKETLRLLKKYVPKGKRNKIYFINKKGKEKKIRW
ncbi:MAG: hypothetical protein ABIB71_03325 [Candidatus Woesearchaeota archaeon]